MKKSRFLYLHREANARKVAALDALLAVYIAYLQVCVQAMLTAHKFTVPIQAPGSPASMRSCAPCAASQSRNPCCALRALAVVLAPCHSAGRSAMAAAQATRLASFDEVASTSILNSCVRTRRTVTMYGFPIVGSVAPPN